MEDILKKEWNQMSASMSNDRIEGIREIVKKVTTLDDLASRYKRFSILSFVMMVVSLAFISPDMYLGVNYKMQIVLFVVLELYFAVCGICDYYLYQRIKSIDIYILPPLEVASNCASVKKIHLRIMCYLIPVCLCIVGYMIFTFRENIATILGIVVGFIFGTALGIVQFLKFMRDYKALM